MTAVYFLCGMLFGMCFVLVVIFISIQIDEHKKQKQYKIAHNRFIQSQFDWLLAYQLSDEEIREIYSNILELKREDYGQMFENVEGNVKGGAE